MDSQNCSLQSVLWRAMFQVIVTLAITQGIFVVEGFPFMLTITYVQYIRLSHEHGIKSLLIDWLKFSLPND